MLSKRGVASRKTAAEWINAGRVKVDGRRVTDPLTPVDPTTTVITVDDAQIDSPRRVYYALNKPRGLVTTTRDERDRATVYQCFDPPPPCQVFPVGRLDKASEGLLLFTNDTTWASALTDPSSHVPKRYHVQVSPVPDPTLLETLRCGVRNEKGEWLTADHVDVLRSGQKNGWLEFILTMGRNRQIRRMIEGCGFQVLRLVRIAIGPLELGTLPKGRVRELTAHEVAALSQRSAKTPP